MNLNSKLLYRVRNYIKGFWLYFSFIALVWAATTYADFLHELAQRESGMQASIVNRYGYAGLFQMGELAMIDAGYYQRDGTGNNDWKGSFTGKDGINNIDNFLSHPDIQVKAITAYQKKVWQTVQNLGLDQYVGQTINGIQITQSGLLAGAHLVGYSGLRDYLQSNGMVVRRDGNGVPISKYLQGLGGFTISSIAPTYTEVANASGSTGLPSTLPVGSIPSPSNINPVTHLPIAPLTSTVSSDEAFYQTTGYSQNNVSELIKLMSAASLFVWTAWIVFNLWTSFNNGRTFLFEMKTSLIRAILVLMVCIFFIS